MDIRPRAHVRTHTSNAGKQVLTIYTRRIGNNQYQFVVSRFGTHRSYTVNVQDRGGQLRMVHQLSNT